MTHLLEQCDQIHHKIKIKIDKNQVKQKIYCKWNLVYISKLAGEIKK